MATPQPEGHLEGSDALPQSWQLILRLALPGAGCQQGLDVAHFQLNTKVSDTATPKTKKQKKMKEKKT